MRVSSKRWLTLCMAFCLCISLLCFAPVHAHAVTEIRNATTTLEYGDPVVLMEVAQNASKASGTGYHLVSASWLDSSGNLESGTYKKGNYTLVIQLAADKGYVFAADAKGYINNSNAGITTERLDNGATLRLSKNYTATVWAPIPVKSPGPETVKEGDWCSFVVSGMYVDSYEWIFETPDGGTVPAARLKDHFPNLTVEGDGTSKLKLYNIPYGMNGWKVYCTEWSVDKLSFANTKSTTLTVTTDNPPSPTPEPTPVPAAGTEQAAAPDGTAPAAAVDGADPAAVTDPATVSDPAAADPAAAAEPAENAEPAEHEHVFSETWSYDQQSHWHACEGCDDIDGQALHNMVWTVTKEATGDETGEEEGVCSVCGYRAIRELPIDEEAAAQAEQQIFRYILFGLMGVLLLSILILIGQAIRRAMRNRY